MPVYKALILNKEINVNYEESQKAKLEEAINTINFKLQDYDNQNGKISDNKLLCFLAIKLQAELIALEDSKEKDLVLEKKIKISKDENLSLNDKLFKLTEQNKLLKKENDLINQELSEIKNQIEIITNIVKKTYEE